MEDNCDLLDSFKLGCQHPYVHSDVFCKDRRTERSGQMILDEDLPVVLNVYLVHEMHLCDRKPDLWVDNLLKLSFDRFDGNHVSLI